MTFSKVDAEDIGRVGTDGETAPKRGRSAPRSKAGPPLQRPGSSGKPSLKAPIGGLLVMVNLPVQMFDPIDALDPAELEALATALDEQCKISPRFRKYVESMLGVGTGSQLLVVAGMVGGRRLARHGMLGEGGPNVDKVLGEQLAEMTHEQAIFPVHTYLQPRSVQAQATQAPPFEQMVDVPPGGFTGSIPPVGNPNAGE